MTIKFIARLSCDNTPCTEIAEVDVGLEWDRGCSPFGGGMCAAELSAETYGTGWVELTEGKVRCPKCWADQFRFENPNKPGTFVCSGFELTHNMLPWRVCKSRHPSLQGRDWGWIENAPGNVCWSNDASGRFNKAAACEAVDVHNKWLAQQKARRQ